MERAGYSEGSPEPTFHSSNQQLAEAMLGAHFVNLDGYLKVAGPDYDPHTNTLTVASEEDVEYEVPGIGILTPEEWREAWSDIGPSRMAKVAAGVTAVAVAAVGVGEAIHHGALGGLSHAFDLSPHIAQAAGLDTPTPDATPTLQITPSPTPTETGIPVKIATASETPKPTATKAVTPSATPTAISTTIAHAEAVASSSLPKSSTPPEGQVWTIAGGGQSGDSTFGNNPNNDFNTDSVAPGVNGITNVQPEQNIFPQFIGGQIAFEAIGYSTAQDRIVQPVLVQTGTPSYFSVDLEAIDPNNPVSQQRVGSGLDKTTHFNLLNGNPITSFQRMIAPNGDEIFRVGENGITYDCDAVTASFTCTVEPTPTNTPIVTPTFTPSPTETQTLTPTPTATPTSAPLDTLQGKVVLQGLSSSQVAHEQINLTFTQMVGGGSNPRPFSESAEMDSTGTFTVNSMEPGTYSVQEKAPFFTSTTETVVLPSGGGTYSADFGTAYPGDANNDNKVNVLDYSDLVSQFGETTTCATGNPPTVPCADFNGDGVVNIADFSLLRGSFGKIGQ